MTPDLDVRKRFVPKIARLHLWHVRRLLASGEVRSEDLPRALSVRANLYRLTPLWDGVPAHDPVFGYVHPEWSKLAETLAEIVRKSPADDTSRMEDEALELLWPLFEERIPRDVGPPPKNPHGCWTYALAWEGIGDRPGFWGKVRSATHVGQKARKALGLPLKPSRDVEIHFANVLMPRSPFEDMRGLADSLLALLRECRGRHPQTRRIWCHSWLNSHPAFRSLFPAEWTRDPILRPPGNYSSWWGQFMTRTGDFHDERGAEFRRTGEFAFKGLLCHVGIDAATNHLERAKF